MAYTTVLPYGIWYYPCHDTYVASYLNGIDYDVLIFIYMWLDIWKKGFIHA